VEPDAPPASNTILLLSRVAVWPCTALGSAVVAVHVEVPFQSSAELRDALPEDPPATTTDPFLTRADGNKTAV
jgi:hypothetical protein